MLKDWQLSAPYCMGYAKGVNEGYSGKKRASLTCHTLFRCTMFLWTHLCLSNAFPHSIHTWGQVYPMSHFDKGASDFWLMWLVRSCHFFTKKILIGESLHPHWCLVLEITKTVGKLESQLELRKRHECPSTYISLSKVGAAIIYITIPT